MVFLKPAMILIAGVLAAAPVGAPIRDSEWPAYGRDGGGAKYSPLTAINRENVKRLKVAWTFHVGDMHPNTGRGRASAFECTPLFADNTLYVTTGFGRVIALDPETGKQRWAYDPHIDPNAGYGDFANRGAATWVDSKTKARRIFVAPIDARLISLDAETGKPFPNFGSNGQVDLRVGLRNATESVSEYEETSPPAVIGDLVIVGSGVADNGRVNAASGEVRAFDARTGTLRWTWDPMPGRKTGAANAWSIISVDPERNLVFVPTGSASPDYYGGERLGNDLYANSVIALRADTGEMVWHFQTVHHDLWDYDIASQPTLYTVAGKPAIAVGSKAGHLFLLDRVTGKSLFGVEERPVPKSDVPGERAAPTQPFPLLPAPLVPEQLKPEEAWGANDEDRKWCEERIRGLRSEGAFTPPSVKGSLVVPGNIGGMAWGGSAFDPSHNLLVIPTNRLPALARLIPRAEFASEKAAGRDGEFAPQRGTPYGVWRDFLTTPGKMPCNAPPWGALTAIDTITGAMKWEVPLGVLPWLANNPDAARWGSINLGGPIVTGGGLVFIGATLDPFLRAFDVETGAELWKGELPTSAKATPMTFRGASGKQYVVIAAGGHEAGPNWKQGDSLVAFALR
ncbi:MAG: pyrroloquinoline quinone-dependent dehydrogenase [Bryobacteraceae bacterium]